MSVNNSHPHDFGGGKKLRHILLNLFLVFHLLCETCKFGNDEIQKVYLW